jgi:hypothetical protein
MMLVLSASASAVLQFRGDRNRGEIVFAGTQEFVLGADLLKCAKASFGYEASTTARAKLLLSPKYSECELKRLNVWEPATMVAENCEWELDAESLHEIAKGSYDKGSVSLVKGLGKPACSLRFESVHCGDAFAAQGPLKEYKWTDLNTILLHYESELTFALGGMTYTHVGTSCGTGTGGEYKAKEVLGSVIVS